MWNPNMCESIHESQQFATAAFADEARNSRLLFGSHMAILAASMAPLADALVDMWRYYSGLSSPDKSPYTWKVDSTASAVYLAERLSVMLAYNGLTICSLVVTSPGSNYDPTVIYSVLRGGGMSCYILTSGIFLSILHISAGSVVTDTIATWIFVIHLFCGIAYYWSCNSIAGFTAFAVELIITLYLFGLVFRDYFKDNGDGDMQKSYLKAVSLTYATAYSTFILPSLLSAGIFRESLLLSFCIVRFLAAGYIAMTCTYLASPKWRQELFQTVHLRKTMYDMQASRRLHDQLETIAETEAAIAATATPTSLSLASSMSEGQSGGEDEGVDGIQFQLKLQPQPILHRIFQSFFRRIAAAE
jgi:hypothetical protein